MKHFLLGFLGIAVTLLGFILSFDIFLHYTVIFVFGWLCLMLFFNEKYFNNSNLKIIAKSRFILLLLVLGTIITLIIEYIGAYLSPAWFYSFDFFNFRYDFWFSIGAYIMYIPSAYETFTLIGNITKIKVKQRKNYQQLMNYFLIISVFLMFLPFFWSSERYPGLAFCFFIIGLVLCLDYMNCKLGKSSVLLNSFNSLKYLLIFFITSLILSIPSEYTNIMQYVWTYVNIPLIHIELYNVPVAVLIGWIPLVGIWINVFEITKHLTNKNLGQKKKSYSKDNK